MSQHSCSWICTMHRSDYLGKEKHALHNRKRWAALSQQRWQRSTLLDRAIANPKSHSLGVLPAPIGFAVGPISNRKINVPTTYRESLPLSSAPCACLSFSNALSGSGSGSLLSVHQSIIDDHMTHNSASRGARPGYSGIYTCPVESKPPVPAQ